MSNSIQRDFRESVCLLFILMHVLMTNDSYLFLKIGPVRPLPKIFFIV